MLVTALGEAGHASTPHLAANAVPRLATLIGRIAATGRRGRCCRWSDAVPALGADPAGDLDAAVAAVTARQPAGRGPAEHARDDAAPRGWRAPRRQRHARAGDRRRRPRLLPEQTRADLERELAAAIGDDLPYSSRTPSRSRAGPSPGRRRLFTPPARRSWPSTTRRRRCCRRSAPGSSTRTSCAAPGAPTASASGPVRHTQLAVLHDGVHNRDERIRADDVCYAAQFPAPRRAHRRRLSRYRRIFLTSSVRPPPVEY